MTRRNLRFRLKRGSELMTQATKTIETCTLVLNVRKGETWIAVEDPMEQYTYVIASLGRECRKWAPVAAHS